MIRSERGATAVEYALMVAMVAAVIISAVSFFGAQTSGLFQPAADFFATHH